MYLDDNGEPIFLDKRMCVFGIGDGTRGTRYHRNVVLHCFKSELLFALRYIPIVRAFVLSPRESMTSGLGPMKINPASSTFFAKLAFSERKPYPG
jgi:hypothetical protein